MDKDTGRSTAVAMCIGISAGFALGAVTHNYGLWIPTGASIGAVIGGLLDVLRNKEENEESNPNQSPASARPVGRQEDEEP